MTERSPTATTSRQWVPRSLPRGLLLVSAAGVVWGTIGPAVQLTHDASGFSPWTISAYRAIAAVVALLAAVIVTRHVQTCLELVHRQWRRVSLTGVATASFQLLFFVAVVATGVSITAVVALGLAPVLLLVVDSVRRGGAPARAEVFTVLTAVTGLVLVCTAGGTPEAAAGPAAIGVLAACGSGAAYAVATHVGAPLSRQHNPIVVTTVTTTVAAAVLAPSGLIAAHVRGEPLTTTDPLAWSLVAYLGVVTMAFAYVLLYAGLRSTTSGAAVVATLLEPVAAVAIAVLVLGERLTVAVMTGTVLILGAIASLGRKADSAPPPQ